MTALDKSELNSREIVVLLSFSLPATLVKSQVHCYIPIKSEGIEISKYS